MGAIKEEFKQTDSDNLADIIWWIKGYRSACDFNNDICDFGEYHVESLRKARVILDEKRKNEEKKND